MFKFPYSCQKTMFSTRHCFSDGTRIYRCELEQLAAHVRSPGKDAEKLARVCRRYCCRCAANKFVPATGQT